MYNAIPFSRFENEEYIHRVLLVFYDSEEYVYTVWIQGHPTMESFQMRPKCLKCVILCLESLFS